MPVAIFILLNFAVIPFINEFETIVSMQKRYPTIWEVLCLRQTRTQRWMIGFIVMLVLLFGIAALAGSSHIGALGVSVALTFQAAVWAYAVFRAKRTVKGRG